MISLMNTRTIITIPKEDKVWLQDYSQKYHQSIAEVVRQALVFFRKSESQNTKKKIVRETAGLWKNKKQDAMAVVAKLRNEWEK